MPDIEYHSEGGYNGLVERQLCELFAKTPFASDLTISFIASDPRLLTQPRMKDVFVRVYASHKWLTMHRSELVKRLKPFYAVEIVPMEFYPCDPPEGVPPLS